MSLKAFHEYRWHVCSCSAWSVMNSPWTRTCSGSRSISDGSPNLLTGRRRICTSTRYHGKIHDPRPVWLHFRIDSLACVLKYSSQTWIVSGMHCFSSAMDRILAHGLADVALSEGARRHQVRPPCSADTTWKTMPQVRGRCDLRTNPEQCRVGQINWPLG